MERVLGPSGWRSFIGPVTFALAGVALLVYDHLNQRVPALVFWLTLGLIVTVFLRPDRAGGARGAQRSPRLYSWG